MSKYLKEIDFYTPENSVERELIGWSTNFLPPLYQAGLGLYHADEISKLVIEPKLEKCASSFELIINPNVWKYSATFNFSLFGELNEMNKKVLLLEFFHDCVKSVAKLRKLEKKSLEKAYELCLKSGLIYRDYWGEKVINENKKLAFRPWFELDLHRVDMFLFIINKGKIEKKIFVKSSAPSLLNVKRSFDDIRWNGTDQILLNSATEDSLIVSL